MLRRSMVDWQALEGIGGIATAIAVVIALVFGIAQVRLQAAQRRDLAAAEVVAPMLTPEFLAAFDRVVQLPDDADPGLFRDDEALRRALLQVDFTFETAGAMVHARILPLHEVDRMIGGAVRLSWRKARRYVEVERERLGSPSRGEWWQWLVERMNEDPAPGKEEGAHVAFREWRA